jgi:hypothetical protein
VAGCCEHGNGPLGSINCGKFLDKLSILLASQEGLSYSQLVHSHYWYLFTLCVCIEMKDNLFPLQISYLF